MGVRSQESGVRSQKSEVRSQKSGQAVLILATEPKLSPEYIRYQIYYKNFQNGAITGWTSLNSNYIIFLKEGARQSALRRHC